MSETPYIDAVCGPPGAYVVKGNLFFKLKDGSVISCQCIKGPYAEKIVEACRHVEGRAP